MNRNQIALSSLRYCALLTLMAAIALPAAADAQLVSTPLEPGVYTCLREIIDRSPESYSLKLVSSHLLRLQIAHSNAVIIVEYVADNQVMISGVVARLGAHDAGTRERIGSRVADYNVGAAVGTLRLDATSGEISLEHRVNPRLVGPAAIARVIMLVGDAIVRQQTSLAELIASS
jgi:hypothetical protein